MLLFRLLLQQLLRLPPLAAQTDVSPVNSEGSACSVSLLGGALKRLPVLPVMHQYYSPYMTVLRDRCALLDPFFCDIIWFNTAINTGRLVINSSLTGIRGDVGAKAYRASLFYLAAEPENDELKLDVSLKAVRARPLEAGTRLYQCQGAGLPRQKA